MKKKQMISEFDSAEKKHLTFCSKKVEIDVSTSKDEFNKAFDETRTSKSRYKKLSEMSSSLHPKDFYSDNLKSKIYFNKIVNTKDRKLETYEIDAKTGFDMGSNEIKILFAKQG
jgi:activator of 2-hydroxyglutaryl-CoA dehydratase